MAKTNFTGSRPPPPPPPPCCPAIGGWEGGYLAVEWSHLDELFSGLRDVSAREKGVGPMGEHDPAEVSDEGKGLGVQVSKHRVGAPAAHQTDGVGVDPAAEEGHGATGAEAAGIDIGWGKAQME